MMEDYSIKTLHDEVNRQAALRALAKAKALRKGKSYRLVQLDERTWKEVEVVSTTLNNQGHSQNQGIASPDKSGSQNRG
jgi:hypothetical protein